MLMRNKNEIGLGHLREIAKLTDGIYVDNLSFALEHQRAVTEEEDLDVSRSGLERINLIFLLPRDNAGYGEEHDSHGKDMFSHSVTPLFETQL
jgi:hypothetical protein